MWGWELPFRRPGPRMSGEVLRWAVARPSGCFRRTGLFICARRCRLAVPQIGADDAVTTAGLGCHVPARGKGQRVQEVRVRVTGSVLLWEHPLSYRGLYVHGRERGLGSSQKRGKDQSETWIPINTPVSFFMRKYLKDRGLVFGEL